MRGTPTKRPMVPYAVVVRVEIDDGHPPMFETYIALGSYPGMARDRVHDYLWSNGWHEHASIYRTVRIGTKELQRI